MHESAVDGLRMSQNLLAPMQSALVEQAMRVGIFIITTAQS
jgi:hypothetical protein